eukprot:scaffold5016_cov118-Isochrysis_galbana.AAC.2
MPGYALIDGTTGQCSRQVYPGTLCSSGFESGSPCCWPSCGSRWVSRARRPPAVSVGRARTRVDDASAATRTSRL